METVLSVRGEARRTVVPDFVALHATLVVPPTARSAAVEALRSGQDQLIASLNELGGTALTVETQGGDLTWSFGSLSLRDEHDYDEATGRHGPTGNLIARASVVITVRDLSQLPRLAETVSAIEHLDLAEVEWRVDDDNAAWQVVRADAIHAALAKAGDYAAALGGDVTTVDHVADAGLLAADSQGHREASAVRAMALSAQSSHDGDGVPTLDPVPQEIRAVIEARVTAQTRPPSPHR